jgi:hypothetical protein
MKQKIVALAALAALATMLTGCVVALGNRVPENQRDAKGQPTLGKQLTDLKQARDSGAINEDEYQAAKKRLIDGAEAKPAHH